MDDDDDDDTFPPVIMVDAGESLWKIGWAGGEGPEVMLPRQPELSLAAMWRSVFDTLEVEPSEHAVLASEAVGSPSATREAVAAAVFELGVQYLAIAPTPMLSLYHLDIDTGLVVDIGERAAIVWPVCDGYPVLAAATVLPHLGGAQLTARVADLLRELWPGELPDAVTLERAARSAKEAHAFVATNTDRRERSDRQSAHAFELPEGAGSLQLPANECARWGETLFHPPPRDGAAEAECGVAEAVLATAGLCDSSLRGRLLANVVLIGGGTLLRGFAERLARELEAGSAIGTARSPPAAVPSSGAKADAKVVAKGCRRYAGWLGGAALGCMASGMAAFVMLGAPPSSLRQPHNVLDGGSMAQQQQTAASLAAAEAHERAQQARHAIDYTRAEAAAAARWWIEQAPPHGTVEQRRQRVLQDGVVHAFYTRALEECSGCVWMAPGPEPHAALGAARLVLPQPVAASDLMAPTHADRPRQRCALAATRVMLGLVVVANDSEPLDDAQLQARLRCQRMAEWAARVPEAFAEASAEPARIAIAGMRRASAWLRWLRHTDAVRERARQLRLALKVRSDRAMRRAHGSWWAFWDESRHRTEMIEASFGQALERATTGALATWAAFAATLAQARTANELACTRMHARALRRASSAWRYRLLDRRAGKANTAAAIRNACLHRGIGRWRRWQQGRSAARALMLRATRFFAAGRVLVAMLTARELRQRSRLLSLVADAHATVQRMKLRVRTWEQWRGYLGRESAFGEELWLAYARLARGRYFRRWRHWRCERQRAAHAHAGVLTCRLMHAWARLRVATVARRESFRNWCVARGACRTWTFAHTWHRWLAACERARLRMRRLDCAIRHLERGQYQMAAFARWQVRVRFVRTAKRARAAQHAAAAWSLRRTYVRFWRHCQCAVTRRRQQQRVRRTMHELIWVRRQRLAADVLLRWAQSPIITEARRWREQEEVVKRLNGLLADGRRWAESLVATEPRVEYTH